MAGRVGVRADDLSAAVATALIQCSGVPAEWIDAVILGCANDDGEDHRNGARMAAGLEPIPASNKALTLGPRAATAAWP